MIDAEPSVGTAGRTAVVGADVWDAFPPLLVTVMTTLMNFPLSAATGV